MGFQFKKDLAEKILAGKKTQTRRPDKEGDYGNADVTIIYRNGRKLWAIGQRYAIQPGRGKKGVGFLQITNIRNEDVRFINREDAIAEGFNSRIEFLQVWTGFYDPNVVIVKSRDGWDVQWRESKVLTHEWHDRSEEDVINGLLTRPNNLYRAHVIDFKLIQTAQAEMQVAS